MNRYKLILAKSLTPEQLRAVQVHTKLGEYACNRFSGAYDMLSDLWAVAVAAAPDYMTDPEQSLIDQLAATPGATLAQVAQIAYAQGQASVIADADLPGLVQAVRTYLEIYADYLEFDGDRRGIADCLRTAREELKAALAKWESTK